MTRIQEVSSDEIYQRHAPKPPRHYESDIDHAERLAATRKMIGVLLEKMNDGPSHKRFRIIELGCGAGDIGGFFSWGHNAKGYDASHRALLAAQRRWNWMEFEVADIQTLKPEECDLLIACEVLEHIVDPAELLAKWLPGCRYAVVSSPINGDDTGDISGGEHVWNFHPGELEGMLIEGGHEVIDSKTATMGGYLDSIVASRRDDG